MSSESSNDEIEFDGFPPESATNARFTSLKSTNELGQSQKLYLPINSQSLEGPSEDLMKNCVKILKDPFNISEEEKRNLLEQLENHLSIKQDYENLDSIWNSKSISWFPKSPTKKHEILKPTSMKINIEIPSPSPNLNNIKYSIDQPVYDNEGLCWKTGMDFIFQNTNPTIFESNQETLTDNKSTQTEFDCELNSLRDSFILLPKPMGYDTRSRFEETLIYPDIINKDSLTTRLSANSEFTFLEKFEDTLQDLNSFGRISNFKNSFRKYKDGIEMSLNRHIQEIKRLKTECDAVMNLSYEKLTEAQFKIHAQNQLLLIDVEQEVNFLNADINRKDLKFEKITRNQFDFQKDMELENEIKRIRFVKSLRVISQMILNLKSQVSALTFDLKNPKQGEKVLNITI